MRIPGQMPFQKEVGSLRPPCPRPQPRRGEACGCGTSAGWRRAAGQRGHAQRAAKRAGGPRAAAATCILGLARGLAETWRGSWWPRARSVLPGLLQAMLCFSQPWTPKWEAAAAAARSPFPRPLSTPLSRNVKSGTVD